MYSNGYEYDGTITETYMPNFVLTGINISISIDVWTIWARHYIHEKGLYILTKPKKAICQSFFRKLLFFF